MGTIEDEEWGRHCAFCGQPITLKWKNGPMPSEGVCLVFDQVFHDKCWDKLWTNYNEKRSALTRRGRTTAAAAPAETRRGGAAAPGA
jgi:hypothetical protein